MAYLIISCSEDGWNHDLLPDKDAFQQWMLDRTEGIEEYHHPKFTYGLPDEYSRGGYYLVEVSEPIIPTPITRTWDLG